MQWRNKFPFRAREQCDFCGGRVFTPVVAYDDLAVVRCSCGYVFMNPYLTESGSQQVFAQDLGVNFPWLKNYDLLVRPDGKPPRILGVYEKALQHLELGRGATARRVLDVGCGGGHFLEIAQRRGWKVDGIDFDLKNVDYALANFGISIRQAGFDHVALESEGYDAITMWDYFEHVEHPVRILERARAALKPHGVLLIACPNHNGLLFWLALFFHCVTFKFWQKSLPMLYPPTHLSYFSPELMIRAAATRGFCLKRIEYDESDLERIEIGPWTRAWVRVVFGVARFFKLSNRFILFLEKK